MLKVLTPTCTGLQPIHVDVDTFNCFFNSLTAEGRYTYVLAFGEIDFLTE